MSTLENAKRTCVCVCNQKKSQPPCKQIHMIIFSGQLKVSVFNQKLKTIEFSG